MRLATRTHGDGARTIALVHGLSGGGALWRGLTERIVALGDTTVVTVDLRGHGESPRGGPYTLDAFADDLVETLPGGLDAAVGHSLGGAVLGRAAARLRPARAVYLDPGFALPLPTRGIKGRLFWATAPLSLAIAAAGQKRKAAARAPFAPEDAALRDAALAAFDRSMPVGVFRDIAHHPLPVGAPPVPSTIVLSDDAPGVLRDAVAAQLAAAGWRIERIAGIGHEFWLENLDLTWHTVAPLLTARS